MLIPPEPDWNMLPMARPLAIDRHDRIRGRLDRTGSITVADLADELNVSRETIRRDLKLLADRGALDIVHGGAARRGTAEIPAPVRTTSNLAGRSAIARLAATLVTDGMVVLLDTGSTAFAVAEALAAKDRLTVITNGLAHAALLARVPGFKVILLGGEVDAAAEGAVGLDTMDMLRNYRVDIAFITAGGLSADGQPTDVSRLGAEQRKRMIAAAQRAYFILESSALQRDMPVRIEGLDSATGIIVDRQPEQHVASAVSARGLEMLVA
jgi:DeoR family glycerol-3-phosphate regulon repressor